MADAPKLNVKGDADGESVFGTDLGAAAAAAGAPNEKDVGAVGTVVGFEIEGSAAPTTLDFFSSAADDKPIPEAFSPCDNPETVVKLDVVAGALAGGAGLVDIELPLLLLRPDCDCDCNGDDIPFSAINLSNKTSVFFFSPTLAVDLRC